MRAFLLLGIGVLLSVRLSAASAEPLSVRWIRDTLHEYRIRTLDGLLARMPGKSLQRHLLAYDSESQQFASFLSPRVIVYSMDADFIMAFNGEPGSRGYYDLEIFEFDHDQAKFHPRLIHFDPRAKEEPRYEANPTDCVHCHQADPRPNWDPYFHWAGFYGSEDDDYDVDPEAPRVAKSAERTRYREYLAKKEAQIAAKEGRYRFLPEHPAYRPNLDFNDRVTCLATKRMIGDLIRHPEAVQALRNLADDDNRILIDRLPEQLLARATKSYAQVVDETEATMLAAVKRRITRQLRLVGQPVGRVLDLIADPGEDAARTARGFATVASWRFFFEEILHRPFRPYSTSRHQDYRLNLGAITSMDRILKGWTVDPDTGRVVLSKVPLERPAPEPGDYHYSCPRNPHYLDMPILRKRL